MPRGRPAAAPSLRSDCRRGITTWRSCTASTCNGSLSTLGQATRAPSRRQRQRYHSITRCFNYFVDLTIASQHQLYAAMQAVAKLREEVRREQALLEEIKYDLHLEDVVNSQVRFASPQAASSRSFARDSLLVVVVALCSTRFCLSWRTASARSPRRTASWPRPSRPPPIDSPPPASSCRHLPSSIRHLLRPKRPWTTSSKQ